MRLSTHVSGAPCTEGRICYFHTVKKPIILCVLVLRHNYERFKWLFSCGRGLFCFLLLLLLLFKVIVSLFPVRSHLLPVSECGRRTSCLCNRSCSSWGSRAGGRRHSGSSSAWNCSTLGFHNRARHTGRPGHQKTYSGTGREERWRSVQVRQEMGLSRTLRLTCEVFYSAPCVRRHAVRWRCASAPSLIEGSAGSTSAPGTLSSSEDYVPNQHTAVSTDTRWRK